MRRLLAPVLATLLLTAAAPAAAAPPKTGFEESNGAAWTTHEQELAFLARVAAESPRVRLTEIGRTKGKRPIHLVELGSPMPRGAEAARNEPTALITCSQHGNEPSGREACLRLLRDLAFTDDPARISLLAATQFLFVPSANPDGRAANSRENSDVVDVNRDHLNLTTNESRAVAGVVRDFQPDVALDLHEYGPSMPVIYDDSLLWLWPRNLNTDKEVHDLAIKLGREYLVPAAEADGYSTDEYGQYEVADNDVQQTAGDGDEGIMRNAMGLRHTLGILVETRVDADPRTGPTEAVDTGALQRRRVDSHLSMLKGLIRFMGEKGAEAAAVTAGSRARKSAEGAGRSAPVFFGGADNAEPAPEKVVNPAPCGYRLTPEQLGKVRTALDLHGVTISDGPFVSLGQPAEPLLPLLLDKRGTRSSVDGTPVADGCGPVVTGAAPKPAPVEPATGRCVRARDVLTRLPRPKGRIVAAQVSIGKRKLKVVTRRGSRLVTVPLRGREGTTVKVRITLRVRRAGKLRTVRSVRTYRVCA